MNRQILLSLLTAGILSTAALAAPGTGEAESTPAPEAGKAGSEECKGGPICQPENVVGIGIAITVEGLDDADDAEASKDQTAKEEEPPTITSEHPLVIIKVMEDGPASSAGLQEGDRIVKVDDVDIDGMNLKDVVYKIRGEENSEVKISVMRKDEAGKAEEASFTMKRARIDYSKKG